MVRSPAFVSGWRDASDIDSHGNFDRGGYVVERRVEVGLIAQESQKWQWGVAPEVGVLLPFESSTGFVSVRYNYAFENGEDHPDHVYWSAQLGLGWN